MKKEKILEYLIIVAGASITAIIGKYIDDKNRQTEIQEAVQEALSSEQSEDK